MRRMRRRRVVRRTWGWGTWLLYSIIFLVILFGVGFLCRMMWFAIR